MGVIDAITARRLLRYDEETGNLFWKPRIIGDLKRKKDVDAFNTQFAGKIAMSANDGVGYKSGTLLRKKYLSHRIIWLIMTGHFPDGYIDHINHDRSDNRWSNLRVVSHRQNSLNANLSKNNTSGVNGVIWDKREGNWRSQITVMRKRIYLGNFSKIEDAETARKSAEVKYGFHENHGVSV